MELYNIVGLNATEQVRNYYETDAGGRILKTDEGRPITKTRKMTDYTIYASSGEVHYAIYLQESHGASFGGYLCSYAHMRIEVLSHLPQDITHHPIRPLSIFDSLEAREYWFDEEVDVYLHNELNTRLFRYSGLGSGDECVPDGYILVNTDLFWERDKNLVSKL